MKYLKKLLKFKKLIGNTNFYKINLSYLDKDYVIYAKKEFSNPSLSVKIRPAFQILYDAIKSGELKENQEVVEVTSGNMGISLAYLCKEIGNPITILMPKTMSKERIEMLKSLGANVVLTEDFLDAFNKQQEYIKNGAYCSKQFENPSNLKAHKQTGKEIYKNIRNFDAFVSGVGTGGTLIGVGTFLKGKDSSKKIFAIDPKESGLLKFGVSKGTHKIQGLSDQIIPSLYNKDIVDEILEISSDDAICMARRLKKEFGVGIGISSGANIIGAILSNQAKVVTLFPDDDKKYLSTDLYNKNIQSKLVNNVKITSVVELRKE